MFDKLVGQKHIKNRLEVLAEFAKSNDTRIPDLFFAGPGGVGKSSFARALAQHTNINFVELNAASLKSLDELIGYMYVNCNIDITRIGSDFYIPSTLVFIDEAHQLSKVLNTELLNALDDNRIATFKSKQLGTCRVYFDKVTLILASTDKNDLSSAFLSRFQVFELKPYSYNEITEMITKKMGWPNETCFEVAKRAKSIMRNAVLDTNNIEAFLSVKKLDPTPENIRIYFSDYKMVDDIGLDSADYDILEILNQSSKGLGLKSIALRLNRSEKEIQTRDGFLTQCRLVESTSRGRVITDSGISKLNSSSKLVVI